MVRIGYIIPVRNNTYSFFGANSVVACFKNSYLEQLNSELFS